MKQLKRNVWDIPKDWGVKEYRDDFRGAGATVDFQNEWLVLRVDGEVLCLPPDLIVIVDSETGEPISTDVVKYGYRGTVILIPADKRMRIPKGIETFGPRREGDTAIAVLQFDV